MGTFKIKSENGSVVKCNKCARIHIEFGNTVIELELCQFWKFIKYIEQLNPKKAFHEHVIIPLAGKSIYAKISQNEFIELKNLLFKAKDKVKKEYQLSQGDLTKCSTVIPHHLDSIIDKTLPN